MPRWGTRGALCGIVLTLVLIRNVAWAQAPAPPPARGKLARLVVAVAPLGWDTNFSWLQSRSGMLDKRPALEYLVGVDRNTGAYIKAKDPAVCSYEHPYIEERLEALGKVVDKAERARLLREIGNHKFNEFADMPLFWLFAEAGVNPKYIAEYTFPGSITGFFTHLEYIKLAQ